MSWRSGTGIDDGADLPAVMPVNLYMIYFDFGIFNVNF